MRMSPGDAHLTLWMTNAFDRLDRCVSGVVHRHVDDFSCYLSVMSHRLSCFCPFFMQSNAEYNAAVRNARGCTSECSYIGHRQNRAIMLLDDAYASTCAHLPQAYTHCSRTWLVGTNFLSTLLHFATARQTDRRTKRITDRRHTHQNLKTIPPAAPNCLSRRRRRR